MERFKALMNGDNHIDRYKFFLLLYTFEQRKDGL